jgi:hypothetical protein
MRNLEQREKKKAEGSPERKRVETMHTDVERCMGTRGVTKIFRNCVTGWRRHRFLVPRQRSIAAALLACLLFAPTQSYSECKANEQECVALELSALGKRGDMIARA